MVACFEFLVSTYNSSKMQTSGNQSNKAINNIYHDLFLSIYRQLKDCNAQDGNYFRIIDKELRFYPIYKIASVLDLQQQESDIVQKEAANKEKRSKVRQSYLSQNKYDYEQTLKMKFLFGSQIYLKTSKLQHPQIQLIKPYFANLYVWLFLKDRGYVRSKEKGIQYSFTMHTSGIWLCLIPSKPSFTSEAQQELAEVVFCNYEDGSYLFLDESGVFMACSQQRASRFSLRRVGSSCSFLMQGRNSLSMMVRNKSRQQIKKIIDKKIERTGSRKVLQAQIDISPVQDSFITIQLQLNYAQKALQSDPSLKLIKTIFQELIYYGILEFTRDQSLINDHLEQLLLSYDIFERIGNYLIRYCSPQKRSNARQEQLMFSRGFKKSSFAPRQTDCIDQASICEPLSNQIKSNRQLLEVIKVIGILCRQNVLVAKAYLPLLGMLIDIEEYELATELVESNQFFISNFYKSGWFDQLYKTILKCPRKDICRIINFFCVFCSQQKAFDLTPSKIHYRQVPATNNQYLLYHSVKAIDFYSKIFVYEIYYEGAYVFIHDSKSGKDIQFQTFMEESQSERDKADLREHQHLRNQLEQNLLISQINFLRAITKNYNYNIAFNYWSTALALAPYCYRQNFPTLNHYKFKKTILDLLYDIEFSDKLSVSDSKYLVTYINTQDREENIKIKDQIHDIKATLGSFVKDYRRRVQQARKVFREMGQYFLKRTKKLREQLKNKSITVTQIYESCTENNLKQWLKIMTVYLLMRLAKVKQKKQGQLLGYIKKIFESVQTQKKEEGQQEHLMSFFIELLLDLLKFNSKYDRYLQHIKVKKNYQPKFANQINKVISNFQSRKEVLFQRKQQGLTKVQIVDIVYKGLDRESVRQSSEVPNNYLLSPQSEAEVLPIKMVVAKLLQLILSNVHQEMIDESVETLTYLVKNSSDFSSLSSFTLLQMIPKFPMQTQIKQIVLEAWYFASNSKLLQLLTSVLRLLYQKKQIFRRTINDVFLFDNADLLPTFNSLTNPSKFIKSISSHCQTWLRSSLLDKYPQIYQTVDSYLQIISISLQKIHQKNEHQLIVHIVQNLQILKSITNFVEYFGPFYIEEQKHRLKDSRYFRMANDNSFVENKLNPLSNKIISILSLYMNNGRCANMRESKIVLVCLGQLISEIEYFNPILFKMVSHVGKQMVLQLLNFITPTMILNLFKNLPSSWPFFEVYQCLDIADLIVHLQKLYQVCFKKQQSDVFPLQQLIFQSPCPGFSNSRLEILASLGLSIASYEYMHQVVFLNLILKLVYQNIYLDIVKEFRDRIFWHIIHKHTEASFQKSQKAADMTQQDIMKRRLLAELAFEFKQNLSVYESKRLIEQQDPLLKDANSLMVNFINYQLRYSKQKLILHFGDESIRFTVKNIQQSIRFQYLQYLVCDLTVLSKDIGLLSDGDIQNHFKQYRNMLKNLYKNRVIEKEYDPSPAFLAKIDRILFHTEHEYQTLRMRRIPSPEPTNQNLPQEVRNIKSKPLRKWQKAVNELNKEKMLSKHSLLVDDMIEFNSVYIFKSDNDSLNLVVNHQDFFFKLLEISLNQKKLALSLQNQIFILEQIYTQVKRKVKNSKEHLPDIQNYAHRLLEHLVEQEQLRVEGRTDHKVVTWNNNVYCLTIKLQIVFLSGLSLRNRSDRQYCQQIRNLFRLSMFNYTSDCAFYELYSRTLNSKEENNMYESLLPFDIIFTIIKDQLSVDGLSEDFIVQLIKASLIISSDSEQCPQRKYQRKQILEFIQGLDKDKLTLCYNKVNAQNFYKYLLEIKK